MSAQIVSAHSFGVNQRETEQRLSAQFDRLEQQFGLLKEQTRQAQKMASLGKVATMLAHEINNLMTPVVSYAGYAVTDGDPELMLKALRMTLKQTAIVTAMSHRILGLAAYETQADQPLEVTEMVEDAQACLFRDLSKDGITLKIDVGEHLVVLADPRRMQQVFFNLLINARQAIEHRSGKISIVARRSDDEYIAIEISDNGAGIAPENLEHIFEEFFSTKKGQPDKGGMGLGLALVKEIIEEHHGTISVRSEVGHGTTFTIRLPAVN